MESCFFWEVVVGSWNNRQNRKDREDILRSLDCALECHLEGNSKGEKNLIENARSALKGAPFNGGAAWKRVREHYRYIFARIENLCDCFYCSLSEEQKRQADITMLMKQLDFASEYANEKTNRIGAFAEVVFGMRYNLPINLTPGFDGGKDFSVSCTAVPSGTLTIDVKGTGFGPVATNKSDSKDWPMSLDNFPYIRNWNPADDHIYVLLRIIGKHAFFRGFAFGNDPCRQQIQRDAVVHIVHMPGPDRALHELDMLLMPGCVS